jgi:osmotically inducible lipoprotein OsmB
MDKPFRSTAKAVLQVAAFAGSVSASFAATDSALEKCSDPRVARTACLREAAAAQEAREMAVPGLPKSKRRSVIMKRLGWTTIIAAAALMAGCTDMTPRQQGTMSGAAIGAGAGAGIAAISGGDAWTGAAIGGVAGGIAGNIRGGRQQQQWQGW